MSAALLFVVFAVGGVVFVVLAMAHQRRAKDAWSEAARRLGLRCTAGGMFTRPTIAGRLQGLEVRVETYSTGGKNSHTYTRYRVRYPRSLGLGLHLTRQGFFAGIARFFGAQDIEVGQSDFDADVVVKGADPRRVVAFLTPSRRLRAHRLLGAFPGCVIDDAEITWSSRGMEYSAERIVAVLRRFTSVAVHLTDDGTTGRQLDRALDVQRDGRLDEALTAVREASADGNDDSLDAQVLEGQILYTGGRVHQAAGVFEQARQQAPDDPEVGAWADHAARQAASLPPESVPQPASPAEPPAEPTPAPPQPSPPATAPEHASADIDLDAPAVCGALFGPDKMSFEITQNFEQHYKGRQLRWSGTLRKLDDFSYDLVFGSEPGGKAILDVCELTGGPYGGRTVQAIVRLPAAEIEPLRPRIGETLTFAGILVSCDSFMRNLYVAEGRILENANR